MSGDRLNVRELAFLVSEGMYPPDDVGRSWDALDELAKRAEALVEIAKAARPMADLPWPLSADERQEWIVKQNLLRSALARLDRPSSDGTADSGATEGDA